MADTKNSKKYFEGIGRRKTSTARVRIYLDKGQDIVNEIPAEEYFTVKRFYNNAMAPVNTIDLGRDYYVSVKVSGGGVNGQSDSVKLGLARALVKINPEYKPELKHKGYLTRDPRMVERKKYHHRKARKKPQFSKR